MGHRLDHQDHQDVAVAEAVVEVLAVVFLDGYDRDRVATMSAA